MATINHSLKARAKATPDRIQQDIVNKKLIRNGKIESNQIRHVAETQTLTVPQLPNGALSVPLNLWLDEKTTLLQRGITAVQIASDESCEALVDDLEQIEMIVLPFVNFVDGRGYSHAQKLRNRFGYKGEIRAIGDVHYDQIGFLARSGVDAFELPDGENLEKALHAFSEFSEVYQPATDDAHLVFARRRAIH